MATFSRTLKFGACKIGQSTAPQIVQSTAISSTACKSSGNAAKKIIGSCEAKALPRNVEEVKAAVKAKFSPHRTRDSSSARIEVKMTQPSGSFGREFMGSQGSKEANQLNTKSKPTDSHIGVYDANNSVSLSSVMQSTVPHPFGATGKAPAHLNMPGGQWAQGDKYVSGDLHDHHTSNIKKTYQAE